MVVAFWIGLCAVSTVSLICVQDNFSLKALTKCTAAFSFLMVAISRGILDSADETAPWIAGGLVLGAIGDVFLLFRSEGLFLMGLISFLLGHVAYIGAFCSIPLNMTWLWGAGIFISLRSLLIWTALYSAEKRRKRLTGGIKMTRPSTVIYIIVITVMVVGAIGNLGHAYEKTNGSWTSILEFYPSLVWRVLGAELFYFSDICVARERFVTSSPWNKWLGLPLYFGGQVIIAAWFESSSLLGVGNFVPGYLHGS